MIPVYIGLDCSINSTGLSIQSDKFILNKQLNFEPYKEGKKISKNQRTGKRQIATVREIAHNLKWFLVQNGIYHLDYHCKFVFEAFVMSKKSRSVLDQAELAGMIKGMINFKYSNSSILEVPPGTLKKWHTGGGAADKFKMVQMCNDTYGTNFFMDTTVKDSKKNEDDMCDAYLLVQFAKWLDAPILPKYNSETLGFDYSEATERQEAWSKCQIFSEGWA